MSLGKLLKSFCVDAYRIFIELGELPRPPYSSPLVAGDTNLTYPLSKLDSYKALNEYMDASGLSIKLRAIGHRWFWHNEVFEWLFLERLMANSMGTSFEKKAFDKILSHARAEISRSFFRYRYVTILNGLPKFSTTLKLCNNVSLLTVDYSRGSTELARLLGVWRCRDHNREPSLWVDEDSCFVVQDFIIQKSNDGEELLNVRDLYRKQLGAVIKALCISLDTPVCPKAVYSAYLSSFPFLPVSFRELEELDGPRAEVEDIIKRAERQTIKKNFTLLHKDRSKKQLPNFINTAISRLAGSFKVGQVERNIVDLIVALEAMLDVSNEELKRRLATRVSLLLGTDDAERQILYRQVSAGYDIRSAIVHGKKEKEPEDEICNALKRFSQN